MQYSVNDVRQVSVANLTATTAIVAAPGAGYHIVVIGYLLSLDAAGEYQFESATTDLMGLQQVEAGMPVGAFSTLGVLHCAANEALNLTSTAAANGYVRYVIARA